MSKRSDWWVPPSDADESENLQEVSATEEESERNGDIESPFWLTVLGSLFVEEHAVVLV